ncbi:MAG TPA: malto-oligosyltrehalose synthase [Xanthobacteraceae bacterium]|nr:malto-oligosyltrehalose synthase [Xanthobacteraceae bacterium]
MAPRATYRLQFHKGFAFADAERLVPYFARLGVSHVYASPITTARAGSMHGYDVIDPTRLNPELGGEDALRRLVAVLRGHELGLIVDIVPNHMAAVAANAWWFDVLRHGPQSRFAPFFDVDWNAEDEALRGKVLLPVLGRTLREAIEANELKVDDGEVHYFEHRFPLRQAVNPSMPLPDLLARQHYRLASWRTANDAINWRRFFDINELAAIRMEHEPAFEESHALIFRLYAEGLIDGVRVDHVDGLSDPAGYCRKLRERFEALTAGRPASAPRERPYIVVEKILLRDETLPVDWGVDGTSGYDFMNDVSAVGHDPAANVTLDTLWTSVSGRSPDFTIEEYAARREITSRSFPAQLEACVASFHRLSDLEGAELTHASLRRALIEILAHFPVYRTYATATQRPVHDRPFLETALAGAQSTCFPADRTIAEKLAAWLAERAGDPEAARIQHRAITQFQQLSAPIAAKAVEDTAFYRYGRLLSRNDVGFEADMLGLDAAQFHARVLRRQADFPHAMLATATHDHKRGEEVRARLAVLSEKATEWAKLLPAWIERCRSLCQFATPSHSDIAMLLQTIVGAWPLELSADDSEGRRGFGERLVRWQEKALREAKLATDWTVPDDEYESAARQLTLSLVAENASPDLLNDIVAFARRISAAGAVNGLAQTLLKLTVPGVPDFYQGTEFWDFSLVDPDNRSPVDFSARVAALDPAPLETQVSQWRNGHIKQALIARILAVRRACPALFADGSYEPLNVRGAFADRVIAFARRLHDEVVVGIAPRIASQLLHSENEIVFDARAWRDTSVAFDRSDLTNLFVSGVSTRGAIMIGELFKNFPAALLVSSGISKALATCENAAAHTILR